MGTQGPETPRNLHRWALGGLLAFAALNALGGGGYGLSGAKSVPTQWLEGSPFSSYFVPSLILLVVVGGACGIAAFAVFRRRPASRLFAAAAGAILLVWISVQLWIIGYVSWIQPVTAAWGGLVLLLAWRLPAQGRVFQR